jgi:hypothetical protein
VKLNRQRTISLSVLGVALLGLGVDRFLLGGTGPASAAAAPTAASTHAGHTRPAASGTPGTSNAPPPSRAGAATSRARGAQVTLDLSGLADRLDALDFAPAPRDAFTPPASWITAAPVGTQASPNPPSISAAMSGVGAIVDGEFHSVGSVIAGWTLLSIEGGTVTLLDPSGQRVQRTAEPVNQTPRSIVRVANDRPHSADR